VPSRESLPGRWADLRFTPAEETIGLGPAVGVLAGALASGEAVWSPPHLGYLLLSLLVIGSVWGRLWALAYEVAAPVRPAHTMGSPEELPPALPFTEPGSLSARLRRATGWLWLRLQHLFRMRGDRWIELWSLLALLLIVASLPGLESFLAGGIGVALLALRYLARGRPRALALLRVLAGVTWPWWIGHVAWSPLAGNSLLVSVLWGVAYAGWAELVAERTGSDNFGQPVFRPVSPSRRALIWGDLAQGGVVLYLLLAGHTIAGGIVALLLLGEVLLQTTLARAGRWGEIARRTWPLAAAGIVLSGLVLGGWL
jgi:hypothetical protein